MDGGHFGRWVTDEFGLPAYRYTCDHLNDPAAVYRAMGSDHRRHWHQIGNDRIIAIGDNHGGVQVFQAEGGAKWLNFRDPAESQYAGGIGYLVRSGRVLASHFDGRPGEDRLERIFGIGYTRKVASQGQLALDHLVFAPFGDHPLLISTARIENRGSAPVEVDYLEYWGSYRYQLAYDAFIASYGEKDYRVRDAARAELARQFVEEIAHDRDRNALISSCRHPHHPGRPPGSGFHDLAPPTCFLASLGAESPVAFETDAVRFFEDRASLQKLSSRDLSLGPGDPRRGCMVFGHPLCLEPGESRALHHAYGYLPDGGDLRALLSGFEANLEECFPRSQESWKEKLPAFECDDAPWAWREALWNGYNLRAGSSYDAYFESHILSQGCTYQYQTGFNAAARDPLQHALPAVLYAPELARDTLRYTMQEQDPAGNIPYAICGHGQVAPVHWRPSDNDLWLLWLAAEYVLATRDRDFLAGELPFYPPEDGRRAPVIDHLRLGLGHLLEKVGRGRHGLLKIKNGDWNDGILEEIPTDLWNDTMREGETVLNSAMAAWLLDYVSELFHLAGDSQSAGRAQEAGREIAEAVRGCWTGQWYLRAFAGEHDGRELWVGRDRLFLEPQPWALLAGIPSEDQAKVLVENLDRRLRRPSPIGAVIAHPPREKSIKANLDLDPDGGNLFWGGSWYALTGPLVWALAERNPRMAWDEFWKNSFAAHARAYPQVWFGIWSGPDCYNGPDSDRPGYTWGQGRFVDMNEFPVMCLHAHAWPLYALMKLCGIRFSARGVSIHPRLPQETFSLKTPLLGIAYTTDSVRGHYAPLGSGEIEVSLRLPGGRKWDPSSLRIDDRPVDFSVRDRTLAFPLTARSGRAVHFEVD